MFNTRAGLGARQAQAQAVEMCCPITELRQYTMKPGRRDDLIALFEEHFIEGQEAEGMRIIGQFRNRNNPDQFVWMRGFADMEARRKALEGFYFGPIWKEHRAAANDTIIDSDNVLLLKPARSASGFRFDTVDRPAMDAKDPPRGVIIATIYAFDAPIAATFVDFFETTIAPGLVDAGATLLGYFVTEPSENTFPPLPVREGEHVFIWLASFADDAAYAAYQTALAQSRAWITSLVPALQSWLSKPEEVLELAPTRRSLLRHRPTKQSADDALQ
jgi:NIPSNAP